MLMMAKRRREPPFIQNQKIPRVHQDCFNASEEDQHEARMVLADPVIRALAEAMIELERKRHEQRQTQERPTE